MELLKRGYDVKILDKLPMNSAKNIKPFLREVVFKQGDIRNLDHVKKISRNVDCIIHEAAVTSVSHSIKDPKTTNDVNIGGTMNVLLAARGNGVGRVVFASSAAVYGDNPKLPKVETMGAEPISPYGL